jgi:hypothetical protein
MIAEAAEKRIAAVNKIKRLALRVTNSNDWIDQNGRPYLQVSGAEKVARLFGISWQIDEPQFNLEGDGHFDYTYKGSFSLGESGVKIEAIGSRSSKEGFFCYRYRNGERISLPPSEIDKGDLKKAAYTNCIGNGITRLLGLRNLTWEDVKGGGIIEEEVTKVEYKKEGGKKEETHRMLVELYGENYGLELEKLSGFSTADGKFIAGVKSLQNVSERRLEVIYHKVKKLKEVVKENLQTTKIQTLLKKLYACGIEGYNEAWFKSELGKMGVIELEELTPEQEVEMIGKLSVELNSALSLISARR